MLNQNGQAWDFRMHNKLYLWSEQRKFNSHYGPFQNVPPAFSILLLSSSPLAPSLMLNGSQCHFLKDLGAQHWTEIPLRTHETGVVNP